MTTDEIKAAYAAELKEPLIVRRLSGPASQRSRFDVDVRGKAWGVKGQELVGAVQQGEQRVLILIEDLLAKGMTLPLTAADKVLVAGRECGIKTVGLRKTPDGTAVAYDLVVGG